MMSSDATSILRRGLLALLALGATGVLAELVLLEHYEEPVQWLPMALLALTLVTIVRHWVGSTRATLRAFQVLMLTLIVAGIVGTALHAKTNVEQEQEVNPGTGGLPFYWEVVRGELPLLAPGVLIQFGLMGLLYAYRHPALKNGDR